jgi:integrase
VGQWRHLSGPLLATAGGRRLRQGHLWELPRRLARAAGVGAWEQLSPPSLRHSAITFALDAGASIRDVQDYAGHKESAHHPPVLTTPATAWTAMPRTPWLPTWYDSIAARCLTYCGRTRNLASYQPQTQAP